MVPRLPSYIETRNWMKFFLRGMKFTTFCVRIIISDDFNLVKRIYMNFNAISVIWVYSNVNGLLLNWWLFIIFNSIRVKFIHLNNTILSVNFRSRISTIHNFIQFRAKMCRSQKKIEKKTDNSTKASKWSKQYSEFGCGKNNLKIKNWISLIKALLTNKIFKITSKSQQKRHKCQIRDIAHMKRFLQS